MAQKENKSGEPTNHQIDEDHKAGEKSSYEDAQDTNDKKPGQRSNEMKQPHMTPARNEEE